MKGKINMKKVLIRIVNWPALVFLALVHGFYYTRHFYKWEQAYRTPFWKWAKWKETLVNAWSGETWKEEKVKLGF